MKTLDEVIVGLGICARELDCNCCREAVHYLKQFASHNTQKMANKSDSITEMESNDALTWDELKQMEGKPVWVEHKHYNKWLMVFEVYEHTIVLDGNGFYTQYFDDDNEEEIRWRAYRKER